MPGTHAHAQGRIHFGNSYLVFSGTSIYLTVDNNNSNAILRPGTGHAISDNEFQRIRWYIGNGTGYYIFPFGRNMTEYCPFTANITTAGSAGGYFDVSTWHAPAPSHNPLPSGGFSICPSTAQIVERFWRIEPGGYSTTPAADYVRFYYLTSELNGIPEPMLKAQRGDLSITPCPWHNPTGTVNTTFKYVEVSNVSQFSPWTLSHQNYPLPVELISFTARWVEESREQQAILRWQTAYEQNSDYFQIERSSDGINFTSVARVAASGNTVSARWYEYIDLIPDATAKVIFYRLRQVDSDGTEHLTRSVALTRQHSDESAVVIYPNPTARLLQFQLIGAQSAALAVEVTDNTGRTLIKETAVQIQPDVYRLKIENLPAGLYLLKITDSGKILTGRFIVEK